MVPIIITFNLNEEIFVIMLLNEILTAQFLFNTMEK